MYLLHIRAVEAKDIPKMDTVGKADPYLTFQIKGVPDKWRTEDIRQSFEPVWNQEFHIPINEVKDTVLHVELYDWDKVSSDDLISTRDFQIETFEIGRVYDQWYEFFAAPKVEKPGQVHLVMQIANPDDPPFIQMTKELPKREPVIEEIALDQEPLGLGVQNKNEKDVKENEMNHKSELQDSKETQVDVQNFKERDIQLQNVQPVKEKKSESIQSTCLNVDSSGQIQGDMKTLMIIIAIIILEVFILIMKSK